MLKVFLSATDDLPAVRLTLEHSLLSMSKWESIHEKPFFGREAKTQEETVSYVTQMILEDDYPVDYFSRLTEAQFKQIAEYINAKRSATTFGPEPQQRGQAEAITSELIYYWLVQFNIPFHPTETWHLSRTMTLIKIAGIKQSKPKKMNRQQLAEHYRQLNEQRRRESGSAG